MHNQWIYSTQNTCTVAHLLSLFLIHTHTCICTRKSFHFKHTFLKLKKHLNIEICSANHTFGLIKYCYRDEFG